METEKTQKRATADVLPAGKLPDVGYIWGGDYMYVSLSSSGGGGLLIGGTIIRVILYGCMGGGDFFYFFCSQFTIKNPRTAR